MSAEPMSGDRPLRAGAIVRPSVTPAQSMARGAYRGGRATFEDPRVVPDRLRTALIDVVPSSAVALAAPSTGDDPTSGSPWRFGRALGTASCTVTLFTAVRFSRVKAAATVAIKPPSRITIISALLLGSARYGSRELLTVRTSMRSLSRDLRRHLPSLDNAEKRPGCTHRQIRCLPAGEGLPGNRHHRRDLIRDRRGHGRSLERKGSGAQVILRQNARTTKISHDRVARRKRDVDIDEARQSGLVGEYRSATRRKHRPQFRRAGLCQHECRLVRPHLGGAVCDPLGGNPDVREERECDRHDHTSCDQRTVPTDNLRVKFEVYRYPSPDGTDGICPDPYPSVARRLH